LRKNHESKYGKYAIDLGSYLNTYWFDEDGKYTGVYCDELHVFFGRDGSQLGDDGEKC